MPRLFLSANLLARGDSEPALRMRRELLGWAEAKDVMIPWSEWNLALALLAVGQINDAALHNRQALERMVIDGYQEGIASTADVVAVVQHRGGESEQALRLLGGAESVWATLGAYRWPEATYLVEATLAEAREKLGDVECDRLLAEGRSMSLEALIELASQE